MLRKLAMASRKSGFAWVDNASALALILESAMGAQIRCPHCQSDLTSEAAVARIRAGQMATCRECAGVFNWKSGTPWYRTSVQPWQAVLMAFAAATSGLGPDVDDIFGFSADTMRRWRRMYETALEESE